jgi:capsular polysaccharide biosynthesis protein
MDTVRISLKEILVYVVRRWKPIVIFALVLAVGLGGYGYLQQQQTQGDATTNVGTAAQESLRSTTLSLTIDLVDFVPTSADSYHITLATNDLLGKLYERYSLVAQSANLPEILKNIVPASYSESDLSSFVTIAPKAAGLFSIVVTAPEGVDTQQAAEALYGYLSEQTDRLSQSVHKHVLASLASKSASVDSAALTGAQDSTVTAVAQASSADYVQSAVIGLLIGLVVGILFAVSVYLVTLPVQLPEQIHNQLGARYLGGVRRGKRLSFGDMLAGSLRMADEKPAMAMISANLREFAGDYKRILLTGTVSEGVIKAFAERIEKEFGDGDVFFTSGADVNKDANTIAKLADSDAVVLVERLDVSKLRCVGEEKKRLDMSGKEILGYVLY